MTWDNGLTIFYRNTYHHRRDCPRRADHPAEEVLLPDSLPQQVTPRDNDDGCPLVPGVVLDQFPWPPQSPSTVTGPTPPELFTQGPESATAVSDLLDPLLHDQVTLQQPLHPRPGVGLEQGYVLRTSLKISSYIRSYVRSSEHMN